MRTAQQIQLSRQDGPKRYDARHSPTHDVTLVALHLSAAHARANEISSYYVLRASGNSGSPARVASRCII
ncbi:MAG: hypothetical protein OJF49_001350 [Ktedonobacterales bacterium]|nr:MAG: hypothetical protein OJF49_001350 [Ktedonobacterales bacterium]